MVHVNLSSCAQSVSRLFSHRALSHVPGQRYGIVADPLIVECAAWSMLADEREEVRETLVV